MNEYDGKELVGIDLHRQRSVIVCQAESGEQLCVVRIVNDPVALGLQLKDAGADPEVLLEEPMGWYCCGCAESPRSASSPGALIGPRGSVPPGGSDVRDGGHLAELLRKGRLPEAWIAASATRGRDLVAPR